MFVAKFFFGVLCSLDVCWNPFYRDAILVMLLNQTGSFAFEWK